MSEAPGSRHFPRIALLMRAFDGGIDCLVLEATLSDKDDVFDAVRTTLGDARVRQLELIYLHLNDDRQCVMCIIESLHSAHSIIGRWARECA